MNELPYRPNVGIVLLNEAGMVFMGKRTANPEPDAGWQMPQGGIDDGETPEQALWRELQEEVGTNKATVLARFPYPLSYDFPDDIRPTVYGGRFRGQTQHWFLLRFTGTKADIDLSHCDESGHAEFSTYLWQSPDEVIARTISFKRSIYAEVLGYFTPMICPI